MDQLQQILHKAADLHHQGQHNAALALYERAVSHWPDEPMLWNNRGNSLLELTRFAEAAESYRRALHHLPQLHDARVALATCLQALGQLDDAMLELETVLHQAPDHAEAHWNNGLLLLLAGDYEHGWSEYEWRWRKRNFTSPGRSYNAPRWAGEPLSGRSILIHAEQGFGDTLQFCRYLPALAQQGARVLFECHLPLVRLMTSLGPGITCYPFGSCHEPFDYYLPLLSLPAILGTSLATIPNHLPYLSASTDCKLFWQNSLTIFRQPRVGLCWAGKTYPDPLRSCPPELLQPLSAIEQIDFFSLQIGDPGLVGPLKLYDLTILIKDFSDSAALIEQLDLVITIDTAVAHLAGALGKPVWLMLPFAPDWRWGLNRDHSPWYPGMRLFRQKVQRNWQDVVNTIVSELRILIS